jgi:protoheme IX farnesyltransferase
MARMRFHQYAWGLLAYNLLVILGGAFVRASMSGDGCGNHWPNCNGALLPDFGQAKTLIEFSHRASTGLLLPLILVLVVWVFRAQPKGQPARAAAVFALLLTLLEAGIGAGLVLYRLVAHDQSVSRAIVMPAHLVATFLLLMSLALTAWWGQPAVSDATGCGRTLRLKGQGAMGWALGLGLLATLALGVSGAITALGDTLFPASSVGAHVLGTHGGAPVPSSTHFLIGLRVYHPLIAMSAGLYLILIAALAMRLRPSPQVERFGRMVVTLFLLQMGAGLLNLGLLAPIWMQLVHLLLADLFWVSLVLLAAAALAEGVPHVELATLGPAVMGAAMEGVKGGAGEGVRQRPAHPLVPASGAHTRGAASWKEYLALTKPRVVSLLLFTTLTAMAIAAGGEGVPGPSLGLYLAVAIGFYMAAGAANAINMVLERDLDLRMGRTATRPTVTQTIAPRAALQFALVLTVGSFLLLWWAANLLSAMLALAGLSFYVVVYTLLLKRRTWVNIVIGGAAGAFPPLVGWAAVTGDLSPLAWCLFGIIFLWTPVHFWALAILIKEDYARAGVPMLPVVRGERATVVQITYYTLLTIAISVVPLMLHRENGRSAVGWFYLAAAALLNAGLLLRSLQLYRRPARPQAKSLFKYSMVYLALLFLAMAVDRAGV